MSEDARSRAIVYRFYDQDVRLLYVGMTTVGPARWMAHAVSQPWWPLVVGVKVDHFTTVQDALEAEAQAIRTEDPLHNVIHKHRATVRLPSRGPRRSAGSVYRRKSDGKWVAAVSRGPRTARTTKLVYCATRDDAERAIAEMLG